MIFQGVRDFVCLKALLFCESCVRFPSEFLWMILVQTNHCEKGIKLVMCINNMDDMFI